MKIIVIKASRSKEITFQNKKLQNLLLIFTTKSLLILNFQKKERKKERMKIPLQYINLKFKATPRNKKTVNNLGYIWEKCIKTEKKKNTLCLNEIKIIFWKQNRMMKN